MSNEKMDIFFPKLNHFWMDSGLLGFYKIAKQENSLSLDVKLELVVEGVAQGVLLNGTETSIKNLLKKTYQSLLNQYFNTSSQKQRDENTGFYYDSIKDKFMRFPKVKSRGIAGLIFSKAPRSTKSEAKYIKEDIIESGKTIKKYYLPESHSFLQERLDKFLLDNNLKGSVEIL